MPKRDEEKKRESVCVCAHASRTKVTKNNIRTTRTKRTRVISIHYLALNQIPLFCVYVASVNSFVFVSKDFFCARILK